MHSLDLRGFTVACTVGLLERGKGVSRKSGQHTDSSYEGTKCRERKYERIIAQANAGTLLQKPGKEYIKAGTT